MALWLVLAAGAAAAHNLPIAYVDLQELATGEITVTTKTMRLGAMLPRPVSLDLDAGCRPAGPARVEPTHAAVIRQWRLVCERPLAGSTLRLHGLDAIRPNAIVRLRLAGGETYLHADRYHTELRLNADAARTPAQGLTAYFGLGVEHIMTGFDHLLFVLGLVLVIWSARRGMHALLATVTAFTLAHSLTLTLAILGGVTLPSTAVEACIAASILLLAVEIANFQRRRAQGRPDSLTFRQPWLVAFVFGLLHGFGFAGALVKSGLPEDARIWALLFFNLGVEAGQLLFITAVFTAYYLAHRILSPARTTAWSATLIGTSASFWLIQRLSLLAGN